MSANEISAKVQELRELRRMADELSAEIDSLQDSIKQHMDAAGVDTLAGLDYKITYKAVTSSRLDSRPSRPISRSCTPSTPSRLRRAGFASLEGVPDCYLSCC